MKINKLSLAITAALSLGAHSASAQFPAVFELSDINGSNGFVIQGENVGDLSGNSVSHAGDINGDGIDDMIIGAAGADPNGNDRAGSSYVVFGRSAGKVNP